MQSQFCKPISQNGRHRFSHNALSPESAIEFVARLGTVKARVKMLKAASADQSILALERDTPADGFPPGVACLYLPDQFPRVVERLMRFMSIEFYDLLIRKYRKERLCITRLNLPEEQTARSKRWKVSFGTTAHAARRPPEGPLAEPAKDIGPPPPFDLAFLGGNVGEHIVPATVLKRHSGAPINCLEANLDLGVIDGMTSISIEEHEADAGLPHCDMATIETLPGDGIVHLNPATTYARLDADAD